MTLASVVGLTVLAVKEGTWKLKQPVRFEVTDGKLVKTSDDGITVEIPLSKIESIHEYSGWASSGWGLLDASHWRAKTKPKFFVPLLVLTWVLVAGIVFQRMKSVW
jgi:hypothetical protein